jgi:hypothetical protein
MKGLVKIKYKNKIIAIIIRNNINVTEGVNFFTSPEEPLQIALHSYKSKKVTNIHHNRLLAPIIQTQKYKYIYIIRGGARVVFSLENKKEFNKISLKNGDGVIIMDVYHKIIFEPDTQATEIKQGPFDSKNEH